MRILLADDHPMIRTAIDVLLRETRFEIVGTAASGEETLEWAWALNAGASVLGSVLAMVVAIESSLNVTLAAGAFFYVAALLLTSQFSTSRRFRRAITDAA